MRKYERLTLADRFWPKVRKAGPDDCWDWAGALMRGYGYLGRIPATSQGPLVPSIYATHAAWKIHTGQDVPDGMCMCHKCDRPICVNPAHLFLGTRADNNRDRTAKGRTASHVGELNPSAKLSPGQVAEIRRRYEIGGSTQISLAEEFGIKQPQVSRIVRGVSYL